jgi:hypothetical protein
LVMSLESMSTKDVDLQFIVAWSLHEFSKKKKSESIENATLTKFIRQMIRFFYCKK